jgi:hypothetical protein
VRPSIRELNNKIQISKEIVSTGNILIINPTIIAEDAVELGYLISELKEVLLQIFEEIKPDHYAGKRPPQRSYETKINYLVSLHENR